MLAQEGRQELCITRHSDFNHLYSEPDCAETSGPTIDGQEWTGMNVGEETRQKMSKLNRCLLFPLFQG